MYQRPEGLSHLIAPQMRPEECGHAAGRAERRGRKEPAPAPFFTILVAFLKGHMQGHVTFRGLNKRKIIPLQNVLFFLFSLCGRLRLCQWQWGWPSTSVSVTFFSFLSVLWRHFSGGWWLWCWSVRFSSPHWAKALGGDQEGRRCFKILPLLPNNTFCSCFPRIPPPPAPPHPAPPNRTGEWWPILLSASRQKNHQVLLYLLFSCNVCYEDWVFAAVFFFFKNPFLFF